MRKDPTEFRKRFLLWKEGKPAYKNGKPTEDEEFESFRLTLPNNLKDTSSVSIESDLWGNLQVKRGGYRTKRYWELNGKPKTFGEAIGRGMYNLGGGYERGQYGIEIPTWHASSVSYNESTGNYEFMKPNTHDTRWMEDVYGYWGPDNQDFRENYKLEKGVVYDKYVPKKNVWKLPKFDGGKESNGSILSLYDDFVSAHPTVANLASFLPIVGTAMDVVEAYKNPTAKNIGYAALSGITDMVGGRIITKLAGGAIKKGKDLKKLTKSLEKEYSSWPYYKNMPKQEAKRQIKYNAKREAIHQIGHYDVGEDLSKFVMPVAVYTPDFIANMNQHTK